MLNRTAVITATGVALLVAGTAANAQPAAPVQSVGQQARAFAMRQLGQIDVPKAWRATQGQGVTVGVLDTGTDATIPDLSGSVRSGPDFTGGADPAGYRPPHLHGTYIASLIAAHGSGPGNAEGMIGVAPRARVLAVRVILDDNEPGTSVFNSSPNNSDSVAQGIDYAVNHGAGVINMSLGSVQPTRDLRAAVGYALAHGVVVVASAGNSGTPHGGYTPYDYPASFTGVIAVAAVTSGGARAGFSDRNASVIVSAPGVNVVSAGPGGGYIQGSGTSPAAAFVSGVAALIKSRYPRLSVPLVEQALITTTTHRPPGGYSTSTGFGEVDAAAALAAAGRLAKVGADIGVPPDRPLGPAHLGAITVTHRNKSRILSYATLAAGAAIACMMFLLLLVFWVIRAMRDRRRSAMT